ncbi:hypothetical protein [Ornithinibacillus sp. JPR2-1]|uniref:hypothetical protein n=1 Tax=Ornithinibacillus sp. JPR2-1 TaxID=2094019 RepID=UPI0031D7BD40
MDHYKFFFEMTEKHPEISPETIFIGMCQSISKSDHTTKQDLIDVTNAYSDYKEELNNERISRTVSAS